MDVPPNAPPDLATPCNPDGKNQSPQDWVSDGKVRRHNMTGKGCVAITSSRDGYTVHPSGRFERLETEQCAVANLLISHKEMSDLTSGVANGGTLHSHAPAPPQRPQPKPRTLLTPWEAAEPRAASRDFRSASQESAPAETPARAAQHMGDTPDQSNKAYVLTPSTPDISESGYMLAKPLSTSEVEDTNHVTTDANSSGIQRLSHSYLELQSISSTFPDSSQSPELEIPPPLPPRTHPATHPTTVSSTPPRGSAHLNASHSDHAARTIEFHTTETFQTADDIWAYFENPSSGGGSGDVDSVTIDPNKRLVHVTFTTAEVAQRVASRPLAVGGETVIVRLCRAPSRPEVFYPDRLMFQDVPENVNKQSLELYLEIVTGLKPTEILYGDEPGVVVVTFEGQPGLEAFHVTKVRTNCQERPLEGRQLPVSAVQVSNCILVEGLSLNTTQETITLYFESKRNNGDTKTHFLDKRQVKVRRYFDCLGPSGGTVDPNQLPIPNPLTLKDVSKHKRVFIQQCPEVSKSFYTHLAQVHAKPVFFDEAMTCECVVTSDVDNPRLVLKNWASEVRKAVLHFFNEIDVHRVSIPPDVWVDAEEELSGEILSSYPQASLFWSPADSVCVVVGMRAAATKLHVLVSKTVKGLKEEIERRRLKVVETYTKLKPYQLRLLEAVSFDKDMVKTYSDLTVEIDTQKEQVVFHGFSRDIRQAQSDMLRHVSTIKCAKLSRLTLTQKKALFTAESTHFIQTELRSENLIAEWEKGKSEDIFVYAFREDVLAQVTQIIEKAVYEEELSDLSPYSLRLLQSAEWMSLVRSLLENHPGALWVSPSPDGRRIYVTGREAAVHQVKDELCHFLQDLYSEIVRFAPSRQSFVSQFWKRELALLENDLKREKVKISVVNDGRDIAIEGTPEGVNLAKAKLEELEKERILCHEEKLTDKVQTKLLESRHCTKHLEDLGRQHQVVISLQREAPGLVSDGDVTGVLTGGDDVTSNKDITGNDDVTVDKTQIGVANGATSPRNVPGHEDKTRKASDVTGRKGGAATIRVDVIEGEIAQRKAFRLVENEIKAGRCRPAPPAVAVTSPAPSVPSMVSVITTEVVEGEIAMQKEFRRAERQRPGAFQAPTAATRSVPTTLSLAPGPVIPIGRRQNRQFAEGNELENKKSPRTPASSPVEARLDFQGLSLEIMKGDITEQAVDVIVVCSNGKLELNNDNTTRCLLQTCGPEVEQELKTKGMASVSLSCARILFLNTDRNGDWEKAIARCLKEADTRLLQTVAIPPIGAGADNAHLSAKALFKAVTKFSTDRKHVQLLRMVTDDCIISRTYADVIKEKREKEGPGKRQNFFEAMKQKLGTPVKSPTSDDTVPDRRSPVLETRSLFIYADRRENIEAAVGGFRELAQRKVMDQITEAGHRHGVELRISPTADQITLRGDHSGIFDAMDDINHILNTAKENRQQKRAATLIANIVQWYFLEITSTGPEQREYGQRENHTLEEAFQSGQKTVKLTDTAGTAYVVDFDKMVEYPDDAPEDVVSVIRRDKITGDWSRGGVRLPAAWNPLNPDVLVDAIQLNPAAAEYRAVETNFRTTLDRDAGALKIKSVYRIQNQTLYQQYAVKRSQLERQNPGVENERTLWHGTSSAAVVTINNYGFSRSYCGKNATKFGEGVYFAVHPSYSLNETFTPRDSQGQRYIYQCKVLTGYATVGCEKMRFLPSRHGDILYDSAADDPSNPELFVIFNDTQAYP
ncbi:hypothetical protein BaRGS_00016632, partial [Batillaria attramentaria]